MQEDMNFDRAPFSSLENMLRSLRPSTHGLDREQLMYFAGEQAARTAMAGSRRRWMISTVGMSCVSLVLCAMLVVGQDNGGQDNEPTIAKTDQNAKTLPVIAVVPSEKRLALGEVQTADEFDSPLSSQDMSGSLAQVRLRLFRGHSQPNSYLALRDLALYESLFEDNPFYRQEPSQATTTPAVDEYKPAEEIPTARRLLRQLLDENFPNS